jgi:hypothetical protein
VTSLFNHGRDDALPKDTVDYVIIGGGISGGSGWGWSGFRQTCGYPC